MANKLLPGILLDFHRAELDKIPDTNLRAMYLFACESKWMYNMVYKYGDYIIAFIPRMTNYPKLRVSSEYCLGNFYFGTYMLLEPHHVTSTNLGLETVLFSEDYMGVQKIPEDFNYYNLFT